MSEKATMDAMGVKIVLPKVLYISTILAIDPRHAPPMELIRRGIDPASNNKHYLFQVVFDTSNEKNYFSFIDTERDRLETLRGEIEQRLNSYYSRV